MKQLAWLLVIATAACSPVTKGHSPADDERALLTANREYDAAILAGDATALDRLYTDDFTFVGDRAEMRNKRQQIKHMTDGQVRVLSARSDDIKIKSLGSDYALLTGRFTGRYRAGSTDVDFVERYSSVWVRDGAAWRLRHEHSSMLGPSDER